MAADGAARKEVGLRTGSADAARRASGGEEAALDSPAGVVDVGSNTVRLLVGSAAGPLHEDGEHLGLGALVAHGGRMGEQAIAGAAEVVRRFVGDARALGAYRIDVVVTAPGRVAADGDELLERLRALPGVAARVLTEEEEAALVFEGAVAAAPGVPDPIAVCDVGGGSTELAVGTRQDGAKWVRSLPVGSANPPDGPFLEGVSPPPVAAALASGGTARTLERLVGPELGAPELERARRLVIAGAVAGVPPERARTLPAGVAILAELQRLVGVPLHVSAGGLREGALLALL